MSTEATLNANVYQLTVEMGGVTYQVEAAFGEGRRGPANTLTIDQVTTLDPEDPATAAIDGDAPNQKLSLGIPQGIPGTAATIEWQPVVTGAPGTDVTLEETGTPLASKPKLTIPRGDVGATGTHVGGAAPAETDRIWVDTSDPGAATPMALDDLTDVATTGAVDKDALVYDAATSSWKPGAAGAGATTATAALTTGASAGTITLEKVGTRVVCAISGLTKASTVEHVATIPAGFTPAFPQGHGWLVDSVGEWWAAYASTTQLLILGPPAAGAVLSGSLTWKAA